MQEVTVYKRDYRGQPVTHYPGVVVAQGDTWVRLETTFGMDDVDIGLMVFRCGDLMVEWFYTDSYYNIFQVQDVDDGHVKGWYCNITRPAEITDSRVVADDLALDVHVSPSGIVTLLDEEEFDEIELSDAEREQARKAVDALRNRVARREPPFDIIP